jgi:hypothetical protein
MIAGILRGVLLRFVSQYFSNIDISKLSLWSGHVSLQNVNLNTSAITTSLNLPYLRLESGKISSLDLTLPWTSLSTKKVVVQLSQIEIDVSLTDNLINLNRPPAVSESEESLLSKILSNMTIIIQDLRIRVKMSEEASYIGCLFIKELQVLTTNASWQEDFINPFTQLPNGISLRINRLVELEGLSFRVISGKKDEALSDFIVNHKFESVKCGGCPLCFGFKESSFYTLFNADNLALKVFWLSANEQSTVFGKSGMVEFFKAKSLSEVFVQIMSNVNAKCNLVNDQMLVRDLWTAVEKFEVPEFQPIEVHEETGWFSWGKSILVSPFACSPALNQRIRDKIYSKEVKFSWSLPSFMIKLRVHNLQELKTFKFVFSGENASSENNNHSAESTERSTARVYENKSAGSVRNCMMTFYDRQNCSIFSAGLLNYSKNNENVDLVLEKITTKTIQKGKKVPQDGLSLSKVESSFILNDPISFKVLSQPATLDMKMDELSLINQAIFELQSFIFRVQTPDNRSELPVFPESLKSNHGKVKVSEDSYVQDLQKHAGELAARLEAKTQECEQLRKKLLEVAGKTGIAGILNIDQQDILCVSQKAKIDESDVNLVLTKEQLFVLTKEGRVLNKNLNCEMAALEEKGGLELSIRMNNGKYIKSSLENRADFVSAIKSLFVNE